MLRKRVRGVPRREGGHVTANATTRQMETTNILSVERPACHKARNEDGRTIRDV